MTAARARVLSPELALARLTRAREALGGARRGRLGASMFDNRVASFAHGEGMRRPPPTSVVAGIHALLDVDESALEDYLFLQSCRVLEDAIETRMRAEQVDPQRASNVVVDSGSTRLIFNALLTSTSPGDLVLTAPGFYHPLASWTALAKLDLGVADPRACRPGILTRAGLEDWDDGISRGRLVAPQVMVLFNPSLAGTTYTVDELEAVATWARKWRALVIEDRVFERTVYPGVAGALPFSSVAPDVPGMSVHSVTKAECLANLRIGWACCDTHLATRLQSCTVATSASVPQVSKLAAAAALLAPVSFVEANAREARHRYELLRDELGTAADPRGELVELARPEAGHSLYVHLPTVSDIDSIDLCEYLLDEWSVAISPGYSAGYEGAVFRLSFACLGHRQEARTATAREVALAERYVARRRFGEVHFEDVLQLGDPPALDEAADPWLPGREELIEAVRTRLVPGLAAAVDRPRDEGRSA